MQHYVMNLAVTYDRLVVFSGYSTNGFNVRPRSVDVFSVFFVVLWIFGLAIVVVCVVVDLWACHRSYLCCCGSFGLAIEVVWVVVVRVILSIFTVYFQLNRQHDREQFN